MLQNQGHDLSNLESADLAILNVCTVKGAGSALEEVRLALSERPNLKILVTGCVTSDLVRDLQRSHPQVAIASTKSLTQIPQGVSQLLHNTPIRLENNDSPRLGMPRKRKNPAVGILPVSNGCLDQCTFCSTRLAKGSYFSYEPAHILAETQTMVQEGCKEIWLTGQDAGCYGFEWATNLAQMAKRILLETPRDFRLRIGMGNPRHVMQYWEELAEVLQDPRVFQFIHLPVQSGSDAVLQAMGRQHSVEDFLMLARAFQSRIPQLSISTDIIVGFPGETEEDHQSTLRLLQEVRPAVMNTTKFVVRPGTRAAKLPHQVVKSIKQARSRELATWVQKISHEQLQAWIGSTLRVLVEEQDRPGQCLARTQQYRPVLIPHEYKPGTWLDVRIVGATDFSLLGESLSMENGCAF